MNATSPQQHHPKWDSREVARIIRRNSDAGKPPACLYLGREETGLLRSHLAEAFGEECVSRIREPYYMGLKVVPVDSEHCIATGGTKESTSGTE